MSRKKKKLTRSKEVKRAVGRLRTPAPKVIADKREKLREEALRKEAKETKQGF